MNKQSGHPALFEYPARAALGRVVPKSKIITAGKPSRRVRDQLSRHVAQIIWQYKLTPETIKLKVSRAVPEIQILTVELKPMGAADALPEEVLRCIDRAIGFPIVFELMASRDGCNSADMVRVAAAYKRPNEVEAGKWVLGDYIATGWLPADTQRQPLPVALDLARLYEQMLRQLIPLTIRSGETLAELVERQAQVAVKQRECRRLATRVQREKQFNRKVELNHQLRELKAELAKLTI